MWRMRANVYVYIRNKKEDEASEEVATAFLLLTVNKVTDYFSLLNVLTYVCIFYISLSPPYESVERRKIMLQFNIRFGCGLFLHLLLSKHTHTHTHRLTHTHTHDRLKPSCHPKRYREIKKRSKYVFLDNSMGNKSYAFGRLSGCI